MISTYTLMEAFSPAKKIGIGVGGTAAAAEGIGAVGQGFNKLGAAFNKKVLDKITDPNLTKHLSAEEQHKYKTVTPLFKERLKANEDRAESFRNIRPTQLIKNAFNKYQDNK